MSEPTKWLVIIQRETAPPDVTTFSDEELAREFFELWSLQWSESYLCEVVIGPGPNGRWTR